MGRRLLIVLVLAVASGLFWWFFSRRPVCGGDCAPQIFVIKKGESLSGVAQRLENQGLIRSSLVFQLEVSRLGVTRQIQAGDFRLSSSMTPAEIAQALTHGTIDVWVTIVEGLRREEIAERLEKELDETSSFSKIEFLEKTKSLEGRLFPDTYLVPKDVTVERMIGILESNFEKKVAGLGLEEKDLILASLIEREAKEAEDRSIVAGILLKRLKNSWPLQVDASVQYVVANLRARTQNLNLEDWWPKRLTKEDLQIGSPYNTYLYKGLPPAPICNPSLSSIKAVKNPVETDFWYYLSDRQGKMHYAKTLKEHSENVAEYLQ